MKGGLLYEEHVSEVCKHVGSARSCYHYSKCEHYMHSDSLSGKTSGFSKEAQKVSMLIR